MALNFIEVCAGAGGLSSGFINAGFTSLLLNDNDKRCCETLTKNHPETKIVCEDIAKLSLNEYQGRVDVLIGGVPCQSFSQAGKREGFDDKRGMLVFQFIRLIEECKPAMFVIENVKGMTNHDQGRTFELILNELALDGKYNVHWKILNAKDYNVPQKRERVFIIGFCNNDEILYPKKSSTKIVLRDVLTDCPDSPGMKYSVAKAEIMDQVPPGGCWVDLPEDVAKEYMGKSYFSGGGKRGMARRLSMDEQCLTLLTSPAQKQTDRCHPNETRPFTVREYARIQTFPDDYEFSGSMAQQYKQIGNAVPVKLAEAVARQIQTYLTFEPEHVLY